jgi:HEAT repeat protein
MKYMDELIEQLKDKKSSKRRAAAKKLRKKGDPSSGPALLEAFEKEIKDRRTWETQYQIIMAIGECDFKDGLEPLKRYASTELEATMVYVALGDAIVRLSIKSEEDVSPIYEIMKSNNLMLIDGAFRAMAMLRMIPKKEDISKIIGYVSKLDKEHFLRFWVVAASPGWKNEEVSIFIGDCEKAGRADLVLAAELAKKGKYKKWAPL